METTFITIQDLTPEAHILYTSDSIVDILGYSPDDVVNKSCWEFFHPDELPYARAKHGRGIEMDKAAVLSYCRMKAKDGTWLGCEVVFTVVYDVLVGCTSIYRRGLKSQNRALEAPAVRRLFSNSPRDPRYHMLSHLSSKLYDPRPNPDFHEPRAALFVNRYTRTLTIMYATDGLADVLGISGEELRGRSFYYCIQENCLQDAVRCLENAKANDSIAYLRFWYRDPRTDEEPPPESRPTTDDEDVVMEDGISSGQDDEMDVDVLATGASHGEAVSGTNSSGTTPRTSGSGTATRNGTSSNPASSTSSVSHAQHHVMPRAPLELEAVVSCTSDGLVVCLRKAAPTAVARVARNELEQTAAAPARYTNGLFAAPWTKNFVQAAPSLRVQGVNEPGLDSEQMSKSPEKQPESPAPMDVMGSIRDIAVFAWALVGINGSLADYSQGKPRGEAQPASGLPIWRPDSQQNGTSERSGSSNPSSMSRSPATDSSDSPHVDGRRSTGSGNGSYSSNTSEGSGSLRRSNLGFPGGSSDSMVKDERYGATRSPVDFRTDEGAKRSSPSQSLQMVDGVDGGFGTSPDAGRNGSQQSKRPNGSGFGFGDPGLDRSVSKTNGHAYRDPMERGRSGG